MSEESRIATPCPQCAALDLGNRQLVMQIDRLELENERLRLSARSATLPNTERDTFLGALITEYGNATYDCGEYDGDSSAEYEKLNDKAHEAKARLLQEIARIMVTPSATAPTVDLEAIFLTVYQEGDVATCPGHGLRWNVKTGELVRSTPIAAGDDS